MSKTKIKDGRAYSTKKELEYLKLEFEAKCFNCGNTRENQNLSFCDTCRGLKCITCGDKIELNIKNKGYCKIHYQKEIEYFNEKDKKTFTLNDIKKLLELPKEIELLKKEIKLLKKEKK